MLTILQLCMILLNLTYFLCSKIWALKFETDKFASVLRILEGAAVFIKDHVTLANWLLLSAPVIAGLLFLLWINMLAYKEDASRVLAVAFVLHSWAFDTLKTLWVASLKSSAAQLRRTVWRHAHDSLLRIVKPLLLRVVHLVIFAAIELKKRQSENLANQGQRAVIFPYLAEDWVYELLKHLKF